MSIHKAIGSLVGFQSTLFDESERLNNKWVVNGVIITFEDQIIKFGFVYDGYSYDVVGKHIKNVYYESKIYCDKEECGEFYVWVYSNEKGCILLGQWVEDFENEVWGRFDWKK